MIYRLVSRKTGYVSYVQTSLRAFFKNSRTESIGGTHRILTYKLGYNKKDAVILEKLMDSLYWKREQT